MDLMDFLNIFNNITAPLGFILTIFTFFFARSTKNKLKESKEFTSFEIHKGQYTGKLQGIKSILDKIDDRREVIPEDIVTQTISLVVEFESKYPYLCSKNKKISSSIKGIKSLKNNTEIEFINFIEPFNRLYSIFSI
ncbi:hypothetical protein [Lactococcus lactis]|uniref:hypothetical protein n=1 Tax=Lactococcus lactis TaxID=1358 RepID=UPI000382E116|nr:hypothetical protein [Lactococcus lactis]ATY88419.1 hypothetical protein CV702_09760 [Lactococcus lactis subsp. lactis]ATZ01995.1 hypothetical protein CV098_09485 [Lactococcus lactis subsp. lactis]MDU0396866.1 hypothetical protein [Lactococcus lactis]QOK49825.1 hypothetical protein HZ322_09440 [Lactococcus lactis]